MSVVIRGAAPGDAPMILSFIKELAAYEKLEHEVVATEEDLRRTLFTTRPKAFVLIAEAEDGPCGFALYFFNYSTFLGKHGLYLEDLYVRPSHRGAGVGQAMLARLARIAKDNDCGRMEWWVLDWNELAIKFYRALGAEPMGDWTVFRLTGAPLTALAEQSKGDK